MMTIDAKNKKTDVTLVKGKGKLGETLLQDKIS